MPASQSMAGRPKMCERAGACPACPSSAGGSKQSRRPRHRGRFDRINKHEGTGHLTLYHSMRSHAWRTQARQKTKDRLSRSIGLSVDRSVERVNRVQTPTHASCSRVGGSRARSDQHTTTTTRAFLAQATHAPNATHTCVWVGVSGGRDIAVLVLFLVPCLLGCSIECVD